MYRLFTVLYFSVRSSRSRALRYGLPSCMSVLTTQGAGAVWEEAPPPPPPTPSRAVIPDARPLGTIAVTARRSISKGSHEKIGDCEQSTFYIIGEMFRTNVDSVSFCVFIFSTLYVMPCHDTKENAGFYRFIPDSRTITIIVVSFLFYASYFTGITILVMFQPRRHSSKKR